MPMKHAKTTRHIVVGAGWSSTESHSILWAYVVTCDIGPCHVNYEVTLSII